MPLIYIITSVSLSYALYSVARLTHLYPQSSIQYSHALFQIFSLSIGLSLVSPLQSIPLLFPLSSAFHTHALTVTTLSTLTQSHLPVSHSSSHTLQL
jgi:hypothetical protein